ncbi:MAG: hypothetical protein RLZZ253_844 [Verrucomicrobiota bacterium]
MGRPLEQSRPQTLNRVLGLKQAEGHGKPLSPEDRFRKSQEPMGPLLLALSGAQVRDLESGPVLSMEQGVRGFGF